jgi:hypothetical protein
MSPLPPLLRHKRRGLPSQPLVPSLSLPSTPLSCTYRRPLPSSPALTDYCLRLGFQPDALPLSFYWRCRSIRRLAHSRSSRWTSSHTVAELPRWSSSQWHRKKFGSIPLLLPEGNDCALFYETI